VSALRTLLAYLAATAGDRGPKLPGMRPRVPAPGQQPDHDDRPEVSGAVASHPQRRSHPRPHHLRLAPPGVVAVSEWHEWESTPNHRKGHGCPYCTGRLPTPDRNLAVLHPELAAQWHPTRNGDVQPDQVTPASRRKLWWRCSDTHEWQATLQHRSRGQGCPYCAGRLPTPDRNLAVLHPELAAQWHPTRNGDRQPHQVTPASSQRVWWRCQRCGHDWQAKVNTRSFGTGCPACAATRR
jgi:DNA-directed RNA polymerase subunit RPC12/RpoP